MIEKLVESSSANLLYPWRLESIIELQLSGIDEIPDDTDPDSTLGLAEG